MKALFIGAHPDDIELGCGAIIHKYKQQWDMQAIVLSDFVYADKIMQNVMHYIIKDPLHILGLIDAKIFDNKPDAFHLSKKAIYKILNESEQIFKPDIVFTHVADDHSDHRIVNNLSKRIYKKSNLYGYYNFACNQKKFSPDTFDPVDIVDVQAKITAIASYDAFYKRKNEPKLYLDKKTVESALRISGVYIKKEYAEAFKTLHRISIYNNKREA